MTSTLARVLRGAITIGLLSILCVALPSGALAQESSPIAPMFQRAIISALGDDCAKAFPDIADTIAQQRKQWLDEHAQQLASLDARVAQLPEDRQTTIQELIAQAQNAVHAQVAPMMHGDDGKQQCQRLTETFGKAGEAPFDADNFGEAVGMYGQMMVMLEVAAPACSQRFPAQAQAIATAQSHWRERDASLIEAVRAEKARLRAKFPEQIEQTESSTRAVSQKAVETAMGTDAAEVFCKRTFDDLDSGRVRDRTPRMFQLLEAGPPKG